MSSFLGRRAQAGPSCMGSSLLLVLAVMLPHHSSAFCPAYCTCQEGFQVVSCVRAGLEIVPSTLHPAIQSLTLQYNMLHEVGYASFQFHPELTLVDLSWNVLVRIQDRTFEAQKKLTVLRLAGNKLSQVNNLTFYGLESLRLLDLSGNQISSLPANLFTSMPGLEQLSLADNKLTTVDQALFAPLPFFQGLTLAGNHLTSLYLSSSSLQELDLSNNRLTTLQMSDMPRLRLLDLSLNPLTNVNGTVLALPALNFLNLTHVTGLRTIPLPLFNQLTSLQHLLLNGNNFTSIPEGVFQSLALLQHLELMNNQQLEQVTDGAFLGLGQLTSLRLAVNSRLSRVDPGAFQPLVSLKHLDLEGNGLTTVDLGTAGRDLGLELRLGGNPWACNCDLLPMQTNLQARGGGNNSTSNLVCDSPVDLRGRDVMIVDLKAACPPRAGDSGTVANYTLLIALCVTGLSLIIAGGIVFAIVLYRRRKNASLVTRSSNRRQWLKPPAGQRSKDGTTHLYPDMFPPPPSGPGVPVTEL